MNTKQATKQRAILTIAHKDYDKGLNSYAYSKIHDHATSDDLVQDTFLKTWKYIVKGDKVETMKAFLFHILNNLIVDEYRSKNRRTSSLDVLLEKGYEPSTDNTEELFNLFDGKVAKLLIQDLPMKYRKVMLLKYEKGLSLKEVSLITGQSKNTIAVQIHRGLAKLKDLYNANRHIEKGNILGEII